MEVSSRLSAFFSFFSSILLAASVAAGCGADEPKEARGPGAGGSTAPRECETSDDCTDPRPHCSASGQCVACRSDEDCSQGRCNDQNYCVACTDDEHCEGGVCSPLGQCLECLTGEDCPSGHCLEGECLPEGMCTARIDCDEGYHCITHGPTASRGFCELDCDLFAQDCPGDQVCSLRGFDTNGEPLSSCTDPNGGAQEDESCREDPMICEADLLCTTRATRDARCTKLCDLEAKDPGCPEGRSCTEVIFNSGEKIGACLAEDVLCEDNSDCPADERCSLGRDGQMICIREVGPKQGGEACTSGIECDAGICLDTNICLGLCPDASSCFEGGACIERFLLSGSHVFRLPVCVPSCASDADCSDAEFCIQTASQRPYGFVGTCASRGPGATTNGADCSSSADCRSGYCEARPEGYCRGMCQTDEDCGPRTVCADRLARVDPGPDELFNTEDDVIAPQRLCLPFECQNDTDCPGEWTCRAEEDVGWSPHATLTLRCGPPIGELPAGEPCEVDRDCQSHRCIENPEGDPERICFGPCVTADAECPPGLRCVQDAGVLPYGIDKVDTYPACIP